jgi:hypothetical protein
MFDSTEHAAADGGGAMNNNSNETYGKTYGDDDTSAALSRL